MDKGSPDNPSRFEAASEWTRVCRTTLHDLRRPPNGHGFDKDSPDNPSRLEAGQATPGGFSNWTKVGPPNPSRFEAVSNYTRIGAFEAKDRKINDRALRPRTHPRRKT